MPRAVRHNTAARGRERLKSTRDGVDPTRKERWSASERWWAPPRPRAAGLRALRARPSILIRRGPHPDLCLQGDLDARAESEGVLSSARSSPPQTRSEPEACGEAPAGFSEGDAQRARPGVSPQAGAALRHPAAS
ncbi:hypothetical protein J1605_002921 [Eschrichtius robustus]|uniref:Uncharacterized protein n=1 Tax=Eschrichtius robustus TaxID=9764 RepID=A0AB34HUU6_ESCRO|nr:hypothetical protein J1605_002921 [Eschrichtius robustus]